MSKAKKEIRQSRIVGKAPAKKSEDLKPFVDAHREEILKLLEQTSGIKFVSEDEFKQKVEEAAQTEVEAAAKELGIQSLEGNLEYRNQEELEELIEKTAKQIDLLMRSTSWSGGLSSKDKTALYGVRVFIRQLRSEKPPKGQAATLAELLSQTHRIPTGVFDSLGRKVKTIRLTPAHLQAAGILKDDPAARI